MNDLDKLNYWTKNTKTTGSEVPFGAIFKRRKRIKIKGWIWKQLQHINAGAAWGRARSAVAAASPPPPSAKMCGDKAGRALCRTAYRERRRLTEHKDNHICRINSQMQLEEQLKLQHNT